MSKPHYNPVGRGNPGFNPQERGRRLRTLTGQNRQKRQNPLQAPINPLLNLTFLIEKPRFASFPHFLRGKPSLLEVPVKPAHTVSNMAVLYGVRPCTYRVCTGGVPTRVYTRECIYTRVYTKEGIYTRRCLSGIYQEVPLGLISLGASRVNIPRCLSG